MNNRLLVRHQSVCRSTWFAVADRLMILPNLWPRNTESEEPAEGDKKKRETRRRRQEEENEPTQLHWGAAGIETAQCVWNGWCGKQSCWKKKDFLSCSRSFVVWTRWVALGARKAADGWPHKQQGDESRDSPRWRLRLVSQCLRVRPRCACMILATADLRARASRCRARAGQSHSFGPFGVFSRFSVPALSEQIPRAPMNFIFILLLLRPFYLTDFHFGIFFFPIDFSLFLRLKNVAARADREADNHLLRWAHANEEIVTRLEQSTRRPCCSDRESQRSLNRPVPPVTNWLPARTLRAWNHFIRLHKWLKFLSNLYI